MFRSYDHHQAENILIARVTQLTTDPLVDQPTRLDIKDDHYNASDIIKQRIRMRCNV
jgi:Cdc6-like AAA superfamily ATPase